MNKFLFGLVVGFLIGALVAMVIAVILSLDILGAEMIFPATWEGFVA